MSTSLLYSDDPRHPYQQALCLSKQKGPIMTTELDTLPKPDIDLFVDDDADAIRPEERGGSCYAEYIINVCIDGEEIGDVGGWVLCGWLYPGAHADLDGSDLALWGDSQPGGWTCCHGDGQSSGRPEINDLGYDEDKPWTPFTLEAAEGSCEDLEIRPEHWEPWNHAAALAFGDRGNEQAVEQAHRLREALKTAITAELERLDAPSVDEPDSEEIYDELDPMDEHPLLRLGDYEGAGLVLAWMNSNGEYRHQYWPDEEDVDDALRGVHAIVRKQVLNEIERLGGGG